MTSILAIETSTSACSEALQVANRTFERCSDKPRSHSKLLMSMVREVLVEADLQANQLDAIGITVGPGSFTGLRIGFATVQGLAYANDIPVVPLSTLKVMVATYLRTHCSSADLKGGSEIIALLDARMSEYSIGRYAIDEAGELVTLDNDQLLKLDQALLYIDAARPLAIIGEADHLVEANPELANCYRSVYPMAEDILPLAQAEFDSGKALAVTEVDLIYLRGAEAWQKRKRLREV